MTNFLKKSPSLRYSIIAGPEINQDKKIKKIFNIVARNRGDDRAENVTLSVVIEGNIEDLSAEKSKGLDASYKKSNHEVTVSSANFFPSDSIHLSILASSDESISEPYVNLRSDTQVGEPDKTLEARNSDDSTALAFIRTGGLTLAGLVAYIYLLTKFSPIARRITTSSLLDRVDREEALLNISLRTKNKYLIDRFMDDNINVTYRTFANIIGNLNQEGEIDNLDFLRSLFALQYIDSVNPKSKDYIRKLISKKDADFLSSCDENFGNYPFNLAATRVI